MKKKHLRRLIISLMNLFQEENEIKEISFNLNMVREIINEINILVKDFALEDDITEILGEYQNKINYIRWYHTTETWECLVDYLEEDEIPSQYRKYNKKNFESNFSYLKDIDRLNEKIETINYICNQIEIYSKI